MMKNPSKKMILLSYLEGMRESYETVERHGVEVLKKKISKLEENLGNPTINTSKNALRLVQGYKILPKNDENS